MQRLEESVARYLDELDRADPGVGVRLKHRAIERLACGGHLRVAVVFSALDLPALVRGAKQD
jgi:hypothetical protein